MKWKEGNSFSGCDLIYGMGKGRGRRLRTFSLAPPRKSNTSSSPPFKAASAAAVRLFPDSTERPSEGVIYCLNRAPSFLPLFPTAAARESELFVSLFFSAIAIMVYLPKPPPPPNVIDTRAARFRFGEVDSLRYSPQHAVSSE